jgi:hypothetical protein
MPVVITAPLSTSPSCTISTRLSVRPAGVFSDPTVSTPQVFNFRRDGVEQQHICSTLLGSVDLSYAGSAMFGGEALQEMIRNGELMDNSTCLHFPGSLFSCLLKDRMTCRKLVWVRPTISNLEDYTLIQWCTWISPNVVLGWSLFLSPFAPAQFGSWMLNSSSVEPAFFTSSRLLSRLSAWPEVSSLLAEASRARELDGNSLLMVFLQQHTT